jgi:hypothetical protein
MQMCTAHCPICKQNNQHMHDSAIINISELCTLDSERCWHSTALALHSPSTTPPWVQMRAAACTPQPLHSHSLWSGSEPLPPIPCSG